MGPQETAQVGELIKQLKAEGIGIFLISHDIHDVFDLADRVCVMKNGRVVGTAHVKDVTKDEVLGMIILGKCPPGAIPGPGAIKDVAPVLMPRPQPGSPCIDDRAKYSVLRAFLTFLRPSAIPRPTEAGLRGARGDFLWPKAM